MSEVREEFLKKVVACLIKNIAVFSINNNFLSNAQDKKKVSFSNVLQQFKFLNNFLILLLIILKMFLEQIIMKI